MYVEYVFVDEYKPKYINIWSRTTRSTQSSYMKNTDCDCDALKFDKFFASFDFLISIFFTLFKEIVLWHISVCDYHMRDCSFHLYVRSSFRVRNVRIQSLLLHQRSTVSTSRSPRSEWGYLLCALLCMLTLIIHIWIGLHVTVSCLHSSVRVHTRKREMQKPKSEDRMHVSVLWRCTNSKHTHTSTSFVDASHCTHWLNGVAITKSAEAAAPPPHHSHHHYNQWQRNARRKKEANLRILIITRYAEYKRTKRMAKKREQSLFSLHLRCDLVQQCSRFATH